MTHKTRTLAETIELKANIYKSKVEEKLSFTDIGELFHIPSSEVKLLYEQAKVLRTGGDFSWLEGLSNRAINQLKKTKYKDFNSLYHDVANDLIDLEDLPWIGKQVAIEIRRWCKRRCSCPIKNDRRSNQERRHS